MNLSRSLAFSELDESLLPKPHMEIQIGAQVLSIKTDYVGSERSFRGINTVAPQQVQLGWLFTDCDETSTFTILARLTDALIDLIEEARNKGLYASDFDARAGAVFVQAYTLGKMVDDFVDEKMDPEAWYQLIDIVVDRIFLIQK
jgi:hypothetical protein